jgi:DNA-directed RNA polymerase subunit RPC12/RpoP
MIRFTCSNCGRVISVDEKHRGKKGKCPKCGGIVVVPERSTIIEFHCESCGHKIKAPDKYGGKKVKCPKCHEPVVIPSVEKEQSEVVETVGITCPMCGQAIDVPEHTSEEFIECPECGGYVETSPVSIPVAPAESDASIPPAADDDTYQESSDESDEPAGIDRRLIVIISAVAAVVVVGLIILVAALRLSRPQPRQQRQVADTADTGETLTQPELEDAKAFTERYISLLENGEVDEAFQLHSPGLADDAYKFSVEKLSKQIGKSRIIEMNCTRTQREQQPEGERISLWYDLQCEEGTQTVNVTVLPIEEELKIDRITAKDSSGNSFSIMSSTSAKLAQTGRTSVRRRIRPSPGKFYFAIAVGFAIGTFFSAVCLWIGMKITNVEGTFGIMLGIAAISSLARMAPICIGLIPCVGWMLGLIIMLILICKWTDAELWPEAIGIVVISALVGVLVQVFLGFIVSMA